MFFELEESLLVVCVSSFNVKVFTLRHRPLCSPGLTMTRPATPSVGLILLLIGYAAAGPETDKQPRAVHSSACQEHTNLHSRLDVVEKKVEDRVEKLEVELAALLDAIGAPELHPVLDNTGNMLVDILEDPEFLN